MRQRPFVMMVDVDQQQLPRWLGQRSHFLEHLSPIIGVFDVVNHPVADDHVEGIIGVGQRPSVARINGEVAQGISS